MGPQPRIWQILVLLGALERWQPVPPGGLNWSDVVKAGRFVDASEKDCKGQIAWGKMTLVEALIGSGSVGDDSA